MPPTKQRKRGRPKQALSRRTLQCPCGGASGNGTCKKGISCAECGKCDRACRVAGVCNRSPAKIRVAQTRIHTGVAIHKVGMYSQNAEIEAIEEKSPIVNHVALSLPSATITDLAKAFGREKLFAASAIKTITGLQNSIEEGKDKYVSAQKSGGDESEEVARDSAIRRCFTILRMVMNVTVKILAGGQEEADELKCLYLSEEYKRWESSSLLSNAQEIMKNTSKTSEAHRVVQALLRKSMGEECALKNKVGTRRTLNRARQDFKYILQNGEIESPRNKARGKSAVRDENISKVIDVIINCSSTTAWSTRNYMIKEDKIVRQNRVNSDITTDNVEIITLPSLHRKVSRAEMHYHLCNAYKQENRAISRGAFFNIAKIITKTQCKNQRAIDYHITDLLHEPQSRIKNITLDIYSTTSPDMCKALVKEIDDIYAAAQHQYPLLIGTTDNPSHNMGFSIGNSSFSASDESCNLCYGMISFFKDRLPTAIDGKIGEFYSDIIEHSLQKLLLYLGHSMRCKIQQHRIQDVLSQSKGDIAVITMDYMMKWEEERARESSREHYGKRGIVVHGTLLKYQLEDESEYKRVYLTVPEGDGTQDAKAALCNVDVICKAVKNDSNLSSVRYLIIITDNAGTYSADLFHVAAFDVVASHGLQLNGIIHNESQDGKTELDSSFAHFKLQLRKYIRHYKSSVLTPFDMAKAMQYNGGVCNYRLDIVSFSRNYLDYLFGDKGEYYGKLKQRLKQVLPKNLAEVSIRDGKYNLYESSAIPPFQFDNKVVKKVDNYMRDNANDFKMGFSFFKTLTMKMGKDIEIDDLPAWPLDEMMTKTKIIQTILPENENGDVPVLRKNENDDVPVQLQYNENDSTDDSSYSSASSSDDDSAYSSASSSDDDNNKNENGIKCNHCGQIFLSKYHHDRHHMSSNCIKRGTNRTIEARAIRMLKKKIDSDEVIINTLKSVPIFENVSLSTTDWSKNYFKKGWARRPTHGKTKGHTYMNDSHKEMIMKYFEEGNKDKGKKKSAALMIEAMKEECSDGGSHPKKKYYIPYNSEVTAIIGQLATKNKKK